MKKTSIILAAAMALSAFLGFTAAPRAANKTTDMPLGNAPSSQSFTLDNSYGVKDDVLVMIQPRLNLVEETVWAGGDLFLFKAARPGNAALWKDTLLDRGHLRYFTDGYGDADTFTTYGPGTLSRGQQKDHDRLMKLYAEVAAKRPASTPADAIISCEKPAGQKTMFCNRF